MRTLFDADKLQSPRDFAASIAKLSAQIDDVYDVSEDNNPLAGYFGAEHDEMDFVHLLELDAAFEKYGADIGLPVLLQLVDLSFKSIAFHNFLITVLAVQEIGERNDVDAQKRVIALFKQAAIHHDFGHRIRGNTVLDALYDDLFGRFETAALLDLLTDADGDMLNDQGGDGADIYFAVAAKKSRDEKETNSVLSLYSQYQGDYLETLGREYFEGLNGVIKENLDEKQLVIFEAMDSPLKSETGGDAILPISEAERPPAGDEESFQIAFKEAVNYARNDDDRLAAALRLARIASNIESLDADYVNYEMDLGFQLSTLLQRNNDTHFEILKAINKSVFPLLKDKMVQKLLFLPVAAATLNRDKAFFDELLGQVLEPTDNKNLAYHLAAAASAFAEKEELLKWVKRAVELGRSKEDFLEDDDFEPFKNDSDFIAALG